MAFIEPATCLPSIMPPSGLPELRQNSVNLSGVRKAEAVNARISEAMEGMPDTPALRRESKKMPSWTHCRGATEEYEPRGHRTYPTRCRTVDDDSPEVYAAVTCFTRFGADKTAYGS